MNLTIAIAKDPHEMSGEMGPPKEMKSEKGNSVLDNEWKMECLEKLKEVEEKLKEADGKEAMDAASHIEMAIEILNPDNQESKDMMDGEEEVDNMEEDKSNSDYMDKFQKED